MKKKILCLLLALLMVFGATTSVFADVAIVATQISSVSVNIGVPVVGEKPDMEPKFSSDTVGCEFITAGENYAVMWYNVTDEKDMSANDVFEEDKIYEAYFWIGALDYYQFKKYSEMTAFVNGTEVENTAICGINGMSETKYACIVIEMASVKKHNIEITNGYAKNADGEVITSAIPNEIVTIVAEDTTGVRSFNWWSYYGEKVEFADDEAETTTFVMPDYAVVIDAFFSDVLVEEAKFTVAGYYIGKDAASLDVSASAGIEILPIDGHSGNCVLFADNNGRLSDVAVEGNIAANTNYWLGIRFRAANGYDICELMEENISLGEVSQKIYSTNEDYENLEAVVFFRLPAATRPVERQIIEKVEASDIETPKTGGVPDKNATVSDNAGYIVFNVNWTRLEDVNGVVTEVELGRDETFQGGKRYKLNVVFRANNGYEFRTDKDGNPVVTAFFNGVQVMSVAKYEDYGTDEFVAVSYIYSINNPVVFENYVTITIDSVSPEIVHYENIEVIFVSVADPSVSFTFKTTLKTTEDGKTTLDDGKTTLDDGKTTLDDGKTTLDDGKTTLDDGKTTLDDGKTTLDFYLKTTKTTDGFLKTTDIPEGEYIIKTTKPGYVAVDFKTTLKTTEPANLKTTLHMYGDPNDNGEIDSMDYVLLKRNYFGTFKFDDLQILRSDVNANNEIDAMDYVLLKRAYFGTFKTTSFGKTTLDDGKTTLDNGKTTLDTGKTTLDDGKTTLDTGKTTLDTGKTTLDTGKTTLDTGKTTLDIIN